MTDYRILVTGSREFSDCATVCTELGHVMTMLMAADGPYPRIVVVHGAAKGADTLAEQAARAFGMDVERHPADWATHGKGAGFIRNAEMVSLGASLCLAFYKQGAGNKGTDHCARLAEKAGIPVRRVTDAAGPAGVVGRPAQGDISAIGESAS
jgi:YspA, cpYpsA-related SLOG family